MKARFIWGNYLGDNPVLDWKKILARDLNNLSLASERRTEHLAARHFLFATLLRWRRLITVTMHWRHRVLLFGSDQPAQRAMIRDREPRHNRQYHDDNSTQLCDPLIHNASSINQKAKTFKCFLRRLFANGVITGFGCKRLLCPLEEP
jgi:hypothetical protein